MSTTADHNIKMFSKIAPFLQNDHHVEAAVELVQLLSLSSRYALDQFRLAKE